MVQKRQLYEEEYNVSPKHLKLEHNFDLVPYLQFTKEDGLLQSDKDGGCFFKPNFGVENGFVSGKFTDLSVCATTNVDSTSSWNSSTISEEETMSEAAPIMASASFSYLLDRAPLKQVPVGLEYQAELPEWHEYSGDEIKLMGSSIIPMPENQPIDNYETVARGRSECYCQNPRSADCVKQHIKESRETLKATIGLKMFADLGFYNMGEVVADKWTEDDEQLFHEAVYSNPVSSGRNFWNHLAAEFPSRSSQEIVSYYFNVFMLRRRTQQNRVDPMNADSDDDESQECDSNEHGGGIENRYTDSQPRKLLNSCSFDSISESFLYDSCASSDTAGATSKANKSWANHEFTFEPLDSRVWDVEYFSCAGTKTDFLPTGSMMEEVFGVESWNFETTDDDKTLN